MLYYLAILLFIFLNIVCDINYFIRSLFTVFSSKLFGEKRSLKDTTTIYGVCTFQDCDVTLSSIRMARLLRELDIARFHFYVRTGIYQRSVDHNIASLQGCTFTVTDQPVPLFEPYKINTKLVYWDSRSLFLEHQVITIRDGKVRSLIVSRQHGLGKHPDPVDKLLKGLLGYEDSPVCPKYIESWLTSMVLSSAKIRSSKGH